jgi:deazaflavin-dependent oxidoreductase (nitroreductase family)
MTNTKPMNITMTGQRHQQPAVQEMVVIHRIFREEFRRLPDLVRGVPDGHLRRAADVAAYVTFNLDSVHNHHTAEDEYLWPLLLERARPDAALIRRMEGQHNRITAYTEEARRHLADWHAAPVRASGSRLADTLAQLTDALAEHMDDEEAHVLPLVTEHVTVAEWQELGQRSFDKFPRSALPIMMGQLLAVATPEEAALFMGKLPLPVRLIWRLAGRRKYVRYMRRVRSDAGNPQPVLKMLMRRANRVAVALYRRSSGRIGGTAKGLPVMLLTVPGRSSGLPRATPVAFLEHDGGYLVAGTGGGAKTEPQWFRNLRATPRAHIQLGDRQYTVAVRVPDRTERDRLWQEVVLAREPLFARYEHRSGRVIPVAILVGPTPGSTR